MRKAEEAQVGDTLGQPSLSPELVVPGFREAKPMVFAGAARVGGSGLWGGPLCATQSYHPAVRS